MSLTHKYGERQAHIEHETILEISDSRWHRSTYLASGKLWPNTPIPLKPTAKGMGFWRVEYLDPDSDPTIPYPKPMGFTIPLPISKPTGGQYRATHALEHREQPTQPWREFPQDAGLSTAKKRPTSPNSKVSVPKHFADSQRQSVPSTPLYVMPAPSIPPTPNLSVLPSVPGSTYQHTVALPFGYTPNSRLPELPDV